MHGALSGVARRAAKRLGVRRPGWFRSGRAFLPPGDEARGRIDDERIRLLLRLSLPVDANCVDVGASTGSFLELVSAAAPEGRHIAYEPIREHAAELARRFPDADVRCAALSDENGTSSFVHVANAPAFSGLKERIYPFEFEPDLREETVVTERLDDHLPAGYVPALVKIDVEGAEHLVLRGAAETLREFRPVVIFEHGASMTPAYGDHTEEIYERLVGELGLRIFDLDGRGPYSLPDFASAVRWNFVAHR